MKYNRHPELKDRHAILSPSKYAWLNYDDEKLLAAREKSMNAALGTRLHALAFELITLGVKLPNTSQTLNMYVNDCIAYFMTPEIPLFAWQDAFGTVDAIDYMEDIQLLRIFDLKNGTTPTSEHQLEIYAAYFCIEYKINPLTIGYDLRIYQNDEVREFNTNPEDIAFIVEQTKYIKKLFAETEM